MTTPSVTSQDLEVAKNVFGQLVAQLSEGQLFVLCQALMGKFGVKSKADDDVKAEVEKDQAILREKQKQINNKPVKEEVLSSGVVFVDKRGNR